jgi:hypothetical protein
VAVLAWQDKVQVTIIFTYHKNEIRLTTNKVNQEETKHVVVCDCNANMLGVDLKHQMLQLYMLEPKKGTKRYLKLFKTLLDVEIHNAMVMYWSLPNKRKH